MKRASAWLLAVIGNVALAASNIQTIPTSQAPTLQLDGEGSSVTRIVKIADLSITSNAATGFSLTVTSASLGKPDGQTPIPFQIITVAEQAPPPSAADFTEPAGTVHLFSTTNSGSVVRGLYIRYRAADLQDPGSYSASLDLTVTDN